MATTKQPLKVAVAGASGETGVSVMDALLAASQQYQVTALGRAASVNSKPVYKDFTQRGASTQAVDFGNIEAIVPILKDIDVVVSCLLGSSDDQKNLVHAASKAGVSRFVPSFWAPAIPPRGVIRLRDSKEDILDLIKRLYLPYTVIDVGWWYQASIPLVPSGRLDGAISNVDSAIIGDGEAQTALTDLADIGKYTARIISDPRTLNKMVFCCGELTTQNRVWDKVDELTGEKTDRKVMTKEDLEKGLSGAEDSLAKDPTDVTAILTHAVSSYMYTRGIRGDNTPARAEYLGYLLAQDLYPDFKPKKVEEYVRELIDGTRKGTVYVGRDYSLMKLPGYNA